MVIRQVSLIVLMAAGTLFSFPMGRAAGARTRSAGTVTPKADFQKDIKPLLSQYCYGCHGEKKKGDLDLRIYVDEASVIKDQKVWEKVIKNLSAHEMPPEKKPQPTPEERELITRWVEAKLAKLQAGRKNDPGRVTIRRLNRAEYNNTIRDLVGVDFQPADDFPADDVGYGFDNIGDVLSLPPILLEKYLAAAEKILDAAIVTEDPNKSRVKRFEAYALEGTAPGDTVGDGGRSLTREGDIFLTFKFPRTGDYILRARAYGEQAGPEPARMTFRLAGKDLHTFDVEAVESAPKIYEVRVKVEAGKQRFAAAYINNYVNPKDPNPKNRDRNLIIHYLEVEGPLNAEPQPLPESHRRIFTHQPAPATKDQVARQILNNFARRAYRRPVAKEEVDRLMKLFEMADKENETFEKCVKLALEAVLVSPHFLFRGELQPHPRDPNSIHPLDEFALASRLSYFLWSSMPDDELFALAERGKLRNHLEAQVRRMLKDPKGRALVDNFAGQWLQIRNLKLIAPDTVQFPGFDDNLRAAMEKETQLFFEAIMKEDRSVLEFLDSDYTFVNGPLARLYGIAGVGGEQFQRVSLKGSHRGGLLTQASILTITSNPTRTSPVKRGKWILENILGTPPPPPPPDVPDLKEGKEAVLSGTLRQRMEQHRANTLCASCHARMDPIGFGFENFDGIGAWREQDGNFPIDPAGKLVSGETFQGPGDLKQILLNGKKEEFLRCLSERLLTYSLGRGLEYYDRKAVDQIAQGLAKGKYKFSSLVLGVVKSAPFQMRRGEEDKDLVRN